MRITYQTVIEGALAGSFAFYCYSGMEDEVDYGEVAANALAAYIKKHQINTNLIFLEWAGYYPPQASFLSHISRMFLPLFATSTWLPLSNVYRILEVEEYQEPTVLPGRYEEVIYRCLPALTPKVVTTNLFIDSKVKDFSKVFTDEKLKVYPWKVLPIIPRIVSKEVYDSAKGS